MRKLNLNIKNRKTLYITLYIVITCIFSLTIVYAALSVTLNITGNAEVIASSWDVHLENAKVTTGSVSETVPSITNSTTATFSTTLATPGDYYEFTIEVVNNGTIDAMIDGITKTPTLTTEQAKYLNYIVEYENGESITSKQLVSKDSFVRLKVRVEFRKDIIATDLPKQSETLNLSFTINYVQSDGENTIIVPDGGVEPLIKVLSGTGLNAGDMISIGNEKFYVVRVNNDNIVMLAQYNLQVGKNYDDSTGTYEDIINPSGIQDAESNGWEQNQSLRKSVVSFSSKDYWSATSSSYPSDIYNDTFGKYSNLYQYLENYELYLEGLGVPKVESRLIYRSELEYLGCNVRQSSCSSGPSWVYSTSYWIGTAYASSKVYCQRSTSQIIVTTYDNDNFNGVRPIILMDRFLI